MSLFELEYASGILSAALEEEERIDNLMDRIFILVQSKERAIEINEQLYEKLGKKAAEKTNLALMKYLECLIKCRNSSKAQE